MSRHIKLKSCPFCGGEAQLLMVGKRADGGDEWYVGCENLHCSLHPHSTVPYSSAEIAAETWNRRADNTRPAPVGDIAAMREALESIANNLESRLYNRHPRSATDEWMWKKARAALSAPPRNCDVGSVEEQTQRLRKHCSKYKPSCKGCKYITDIQKENCWLKWAQMPCDEKGENDGGK